MAAEGCADTRIAREVAVSSATATNWRGRFCEDGLKNFSSVRPGRKRTPSIPVSRIEELVHATLHETPPGHTHWSFRTMAGGGGVSAATVQRIWSARRIRPHQLGAC